MAVGTNARAHKRHSSFLDEKIYDDMSIIKEYTGLSKNQQINEALSKHYIPVMISEIVKMRKQRNTLASLST
jgi:hypothetical protein|tara:strand:- start:650 stop:865 length:216 start_codon:yes stop_codon:yes gene_type:complete